MGTNLLRYLTCVLIISVYVIKGESTSFESWKNQYLNSHICKGKVNQCKRQLTEGEDKAKGPKFNSNIKESVKIVHLYTHNNPPFYKSLNQNCNSGDKLYSDYRLLLTKAIDTIKTYNYPSWRQGVTTYRGIYVSDYSNFKAKKQGDSWDLTGFTSSSMNALIGLRFALQSVLLEMTNVEGLYLESYTRYPGEEEVLVKHPSTYRIVEKLTDANQIKNKIDNLVNSNPYGYPKMYFKLRMIQAGKRRRRSTSTYTSCDFTSDGISVVPTFMGVFILVLLAVMF